MIKVNHIYYTEMIENGNVEIPTTEWVTKKSKYYGKVSYYYPSGLKTFIKVWDNEKKEMVLIREDFCDIEIID